MTEEHLKGIQQGARLALLSQIQEKLKEMKNHTHFNNGKLQNIYEYTLTEVSNYLKELE